MKKNKIYGIHKLDARNINGLIKDTIVDVTVTSPPYFDMKDYGYKGQIGFGQSYIDYLNDIEIVFKKIYNCTKDTGSLWVIVDALRKNGEIIALPFDIADRIKKGGWKFKEIIIWEKDRTVPWIHKGQMRNSFEYILVFSKTNNFKFFIDKVRKYDSLKKWWIKYPERYNPRGKTPDGIWHFPIPTQGAWGNGYIRHFCPLPEEMVEQILTITTEEGDVVLDPFSGSGTVLAKADNMKRKYIGTELNSDYIKMFKNYITKTSKLKKQEYEKDQEYLFEQGQFEKIILNLRALKYARVLLQKLKDYKINSVTHIRVEMSPKSKNKKNSLIGVEYKILSAENIDKILEEIISKAPLSKFGIEPVFSYAKNMSEILEFPKNKKLNTYTSKITNKFARKITAKDKILDNEVILSSISVDFEEKDFEE